MAESSGFFDAEELVGGGYDREYVSKQFSDYFALFIGNGVFASPTNQLKVVAGTGMKIIVKSGWAFINGRWYHNDSDLELTIPANTTAQTMRLGVFVQASTLERDIHTVTAVGRTNINREAPIYELKLAEIAVPTGATAITNAMITDTRMNEQVCGVVKGLLDGVISTNDLFAQYTDMFNTWFNTVKGQLSGDAAGHLQDEIDDINTTLEELDAAHISFNDTTAQTGSNNVQGAIEALKTAFSSALTALKNTAIAQAVGANGATFTSVINKLGEIVNHGNVSQTLNPNSSYTIPQGLHAGGGIITAKANTDTYSVTSNGTHDMGISNLNRYLDVNVPIDPSRVSIQRVSNIAVGNYYIVVVQTGINDRPVEPTVSGATVLEAYSNNATSDGFGHYCWTKVFKVYATTNNITTNGNTFILSIS